MLTGIEKRDSKDTDSCENKEKWAIIIENKLYHDVVNPLQSYWDHIKVVENKIGVILSLFPVDKKKLEVPKRDVSYINILHKDLIETVSNRFSFSSNYSETNLFYLKEYVKTIESHYASKKNVTIMNKAIHDLIRQKEKVNSMLRAINETEKYILEQINDSFSKRGFTVFNSNKTFFKNENMPGLFFAVRLNEFLSENAMKVYLVVFTSKVNEQLIENMKTLAKSVIGASNDYYSIDGIYAGSQHTHIVQYINSNFLDGDKPFDTEFNNMLDEFFFSENGIVRKIEEKFAVELMNDQKT